MTQHSTRGAGLLAGKAASLIAIDLTLSGETLRPRDARRLAVKPQIVP